MSVQSNGVCAAFPSRIASRNSSKGLEEMLHDGSYELATIFFSPFFSPFLFAWPFNRKYNFFYQGNVWITESELAAQE